MKIKKYCCKCCGRILFEGDFIGTVIVICRKCKTKNTYTNN